MDSNNKRIAKNTMFLYVRMLLTLIVGLYTSRVVLRTLGVSDYGLYNVVGGVVTMFTFFNATLRTGTQRFLSFALGEGNLEKLKLVFSTAFYLHVFFSILLLVLIEVAGLWFLQHKLNIPEGREVAAYWIFQFSTLASVVTVIQVPYMSSIIAHEKMDIYAYMSIYDVIMKLLIVFMIQIIDNDKLILYGFLYLLVNITSAVIYNIYCRKHFDECKRVVFSYDKRIFKEILTFSGWNVFGCAAGAFQIQGLNILLNLFFNTIVNAARGIALQINNIIMQFVNNFLTAVNPQIIKLYANSQIEELNKLVTNSAKYAAYMLLFISIPVFVEEKFLLDIWLGDYPDYTLSFVRIILVQSLIQTMTRPIVTLCHATGKMKMPNLTAGSVLLAILPVSYLLLLMGVDPNVVMIANIVPWILETIIDGYWVYRYAQFPIISFMKEVYGHVIPLSILMLSFPLLLHKFLLCNEILRFFIVCACSVVFSTICLYSIGIPRSLRISIKNKVKSYIHR